MQLPPRFSDGPLLAVWAHPDDETYFSGGLLAQAVESGRPVTVVTATAGENGTDDPLEWPSDRLGRTRAFEVAASMAVLGVTDHRTLGYPDGSCDEVDHLDAVCRLVQIIDEVRPSTIVTFGADGITGHRDHKAVASWIRDAWRMTDHGSHLLAATLTEESHRHFSALDAKLSVMMDGHRPIASDRRDLALHLRLGGSPLDQKLAALRAQATQTARVMEVLGDRYEAMVSEEAFVLITPGEAGPRTPLPSVGRGMELIR